MMGKSDVTDWRNEFQYLLDGKILTRDELGYLFGQIKSIVDRENQQLQTENWRLREEVMSWRRVAEKLEREKQALQG